MLGTRKFRTHAAKRKEQQRLALKTVGFAVVGACVLALCVYVLNESYARIQSVTLVYDGALNKADIEEVLDSVLGGYTLGIIPNDSLIFFAKGDLRAAILQTFPRTRDVEVRRTNGNELAVFVKDRKPVALWCGDIVPATVSDRFYLRTAVTEELWGVCYLMDRNSFIYAKAPVYTGDIYVRYYGPLLMASPIGQNFIPEEEFSAWNTFSEQAHERGYDVEAMLIADEHDIEVYMANGHKILMPRSEPELALSRFKTLLEAEVVDTTSTVDYIDLRFDTKVYIKYLEEVDVDGQQTLE